MAFWVLCSYAIFALLHKSGKLISCILFVISAVLIFASMSRSAFIGLLVMFLGVIISFLKPNDIKERNKPELAKIIFRIFLTAFFITLAIVNLSENESFLSILNRLVETDYREQAEIRGYMRIFDYPEYLIFGASQRADIRVGALNEIHSTWMAFLFYYGIAGILLFGIFMYFILKRLNFNQVLISAGPLMYSFFTFGARTPIFWVFLACTLYAGKETRHRQFMGKRHLTVSPISPKVIATKY